MAGFPPGKLTDRLRGIYKLAVDMNVGPLDGKDTFTREFFVPPIQHEAAARIEELERAQVWREGTTSCAYCRKNQAFRPIMPCLDCLTGDARESWNNIDALRSTIDELKCTLETYKTDHDANVAEMEESKRKADAAELAAQHTMAAVFVTSGVAPPGGELSLDRLGGMAIEAVRQQRLRLDEAEALIRMTQTTHGCWCDDSWKPKMLGHTDRCQRITAFQERKPR